MLLSSGGGAPFILSNTIQHYSTPLLPAKFFLYLVSDGEFNGLQIKAGSLIFNMLTYPQHVRECGENIRHYK
jgi:hypothetical protein